MNDFIQGYRYLSEGAMVQALDIFCEIHRANQNIIITSRAVEALDRPGSAAAHAEIADQIEHAEGTPASRTANLLDEIIQLTIILGRVSVTDDVYKSVKIPNGSYLIMHKIRSTNDRESAMYYLKVLSCLYFLEKGELYYALEVYREDLAKQSEDTRQALLKLGRVNDTISEMVRGIELILSKHLYLSKDDTEIPSSFSREIHGGLLYTFRMIFRNYQMNVLNESYPDTFRLKYSDQCLAYIYNIKEHNPILSQNLFGIHFVEAHIRILQLVNFVCFDVSRNIIMPDSNATSQNGTVNPKLLPYDDALKMFSQASSVYMNALDKFLEQSYSRYSDLGEGDTIYLNENVVSTIVNQLQTLIKTIEEYHGAGASTPITEMAFSRLEKYLSDFLVKVTNACELSDYPLKQVERRLSSTLKNFVNSSEIQGADVNDSSEIATAMDRITNLHKLSKEVVRHVRLDEILHTDKPGTAMGKNLRRFYYNPTFKINTTEVADHLRRICDVDHLTEYYKGIQAVALDDASLKLVELVDSTEDTKQYHLNMNHHIDKLMRYEIQVIEMITYALITLGLDSYHDIKKRIIDYVELHANSYSFTETDIPFEHAMFFSTLMNYTVSTTNQSLFKMMESFILKLISARVLHRRIERIADQFSPETLEKACHFYHINFSRIGTMIQGMSHVDVSPININSAGTQIRDVLNARANMIKLGIVDQRYGQTQLLPRSLAKYAGPLMLLNHEMREIKLQNDLRRAQKAVLDAQLKSRQELAAAEQLGMILPEKSSVASRSRNEKNDAKALVYNCISNRLINFDTIHRDLRESDSLINQLLAAISMMDINHNSYPYIIYISLDTEGYSDIRLIKIVLIDKETADCGTILRKDLETSDIERPQFYISVSNDVLKIKPLNQVHNRQYHRS